MTLARMFIYLILGTGAVTVACRLLRIYYHRKDLKRFQHLVKGRVDL